MPKLLVLRHENAVLRRRIIRVRYTPADRMWLTALSLFLSLLLPRRRWAEVFAVTSATILAWHHKPVSRKWDYTAHYRPGHLLTVAVIKQTRKPADQTPIVYPSPTGSLAAVSGTSILL